MRPVSKSSTARSAESTAARAETSSSIDRSRSPAAAVDPSASAGVGTLTRGDVPCYGPGLHDLIERNARLGRQHFTTNTAEAVAGAEIAFIAVGTPSAADGSADLTYVMEAAKQIGAAMTGFTVIVTKSTVPVGTAANVKAAVATTAKHPYAVASNPEFLKEGDAVNDFLR